MSTLAKDKPRAYEFTGAHPDYNELPAVATDIIYAGSAVGESTTTGTYRPLAGGDTFGGFCIEQCDNSAGAANAKLIKVYCTGVVWLPVTGADNINDADSTVYASDDDTFTLTSTTTSTAIGKLKRYDQETTRSLVYFEAASMRSI
jgi:hypothetical protein